MKRSVYFLLFIFLISSLGCPERKQVPPAPQLPPPQVIQTVYDWVDVIEILKGMAPLVGPAPWFFQMVA